MASVTVPPVTAQDVARSGSPDLATKLVVALSLNHGFAAAESFVARNLPEKMEARRATGAPPLDMNDTDKAALHFARRREFLGASAMLAAGLALPVGATAAGLAIEYETGKVLPEAIETLPVPQQVLAYTSLFCAPAAGIGGAVAALQHKDQQLSAPRYPEGVPPPPQVDTFLTAASEALTDLLRKPRTEVIPGPLAIDGKGKGR